MFASYPIIRGVVFGFSLFSERFEDINYGGLSSLSGLISALRLF